MHDDAASHLISLTVRHRVRTTTVRDDMVGWVVSGHKRLVTPQGSTGFRSGDVFVIPRATQWDMVNDPAPQGRYIARVLTFAPPLVELFHERFGQFAATPAVQGCASLAADEAFAATFGHAVAALEDSETSQAMRQHRALEVLLLLAERGLVFAPARELGWADRVRRLAQEATSVSQCVREVRLETALGLLQTTELQVSEIAGRCGYESHSRFSAAFRERFGFAPSHLRP